MREQTFKCVCCWNCLRHAGRKVKSYYKRLTRKGVRRIYKRTIRDEIQKEASSN